jgi:hypothetical protein
VAAADCPDDVVAKLQGALARVASAPECASLRDRLGLDGFAQVAASDYELMLQWEEAACSAGYAEPG